MKALCLVGRSGVGKTTLLEQAVAMLSEQGLRVLALKSSHHRFPDTPGSDSQRLSAAGASGTLLLGATSVQLQLEPPPCLEELLTWLAARFDVALIEGGKRSALPKVELVADQPPLLSREEALEHLERGPFGSTGAARRVVALLEQHGTHFGAAPAGDKGDKGALSV